MTEQAPYTPKEERIATLHNVELELLGTAGHNAIFKVRGFDSFDRGETNITERSMKVDLAAQNNQIVVPLTTEEDRQMIHSTPKWSHFTVENATISQADMEEVLYRPTTKGHTYLPTFTVKSGTFKPKEQKPTQDLNLSF